MKHVMSFLQGLLLLLFLGLPSEVLAQKESPELREFIFTVEKINRGLKLIGVEGTAWKELTFTLADDLPQAVNELGMTRLSDAQRAKDENLAAFLFTLTLSGNKLKLEGVEGTAWTSLAFTIDRFEKKAIDQFGMITLER